MGLLPVPEQQEMDDVSQVTDRGQSSEQPRALSAGCLLFHFPSLFSVSSSPLSSGQLPSLLVFITNKRFSGTTFASFG